VLAPASISGSMRWKAMTRRRREDAARLEGGEQTVLLRKQLEAWTMGVVALAVPAIRTLSASGLRARQPDRALFEDKEARSKVLILDAKDTIPHSACSRTPGRICMAA